VIFNPGLGYLLAGSGKKGHIGHFDTLLRTRPAIR